MIVDFHTHIFSPQIKECRSDYAALDPTFAQLYSSPKAKIATVDDLIASMDQDDIDVSVVLNIGWPSQELCVETNNYIIESVARYPNRIVGFCAVQPTAGELALAEIERCARAGVVGIGELRPDDQGFDLGDDKVMGPVMEMLKKYNMIFLTHASEPVGHVYQGKGKVTPDMLYRFLCAFPDVPVVFAHWGGGLPFYALMPEVQESLKNAYFDTAASPFLYRPQIFERVIDLIGADKILFGSDHPLITQHRIPDQMESIGLSSEIKKQILGGNAERLLRAAGALQMQE